MTATYNKELFPYIVIGNGVTDRPLHLSGILSKRKIRYPIPTYQYATNMDIARSIADKMKEWNETVWICKVEEVIE